MQTEVQRRKDVIRKAFSALNDRDRDLFRGLHTEDVIVHAPTGDVHGVDALIDVEWSHIEAFPDLRYELEDMIEEGDRIATRHRAVGTHEGELMGIEPTGKQVEFPVMIMFRFEGERVAEAWLNADRLGMLRQLGVLETMTA